MEPDTVIVANAVQRDSNAGKLFDKRDKFRTEIRKISKKGFLNNHRKEIIEVLREELLQQLSQMFNGINEQTTIAMLVTLELQSNSKDFNLRLLDMKLESKLVRLLEQPGAALEIKMSAVKVLKKLSDYSSSEGVEGITRQTIDVLLNEINVYSFRQDLQREYLIDVLKLLVEIASSKNETLHQALMEINLHRIVLNKMIYQDGTDIVCLEDDGLRIIALLYKYRRRLLLVKYDLTLAKSTLSLLSEEFSEYDGFSRREFCLCVLAAISGCPDEDLRQLEEVLFGSHLLANLENFFDDLLDEQETEALLRMIYELGYQYPNDVVVLFSIVPLNFLVNCLCDQRNPDLQYITARIFDGNGGWICRTYKENEEQSKLMCEAVLKGMQQENRDRYLGTIEGFIVNHNSWPRLTEYLLKEQLITKLYDVMGKEGLRVEDTQQILKIVHSLVSYSKWTNEDRIPRALQSIGIIQIVERLQNHENQDIYLQAASIMNECRLIQDELQHD